MTLFSMGNIILGVFMSRWLLDRTSTIGIPWSIVGLNTIGRLRGDLSMVNDH